MKELAKNVLNQIEEAASGADYLQVDIMEEIERINEIHLKLSSLFQNMFESAKQANNRTRIALGERISPILDEIDFGIFGKTTDPVPRTEDKAGIGVMPIADDGKALLSINVHASTWKDFDDNQNRSQLSEHMWVVLEGLDIQYRKLKREGKFVSVKDLQHYNEDSGA